MHWFELAWCTKGPLLPDCSSDAIADDLLTAGCLVYPSNGRRISDTLLFQT